MPAIPLAAHFLAGSLLTILLPLALVVVLTVWYNLAVRRVPADTPESSSALPAPEVVQAADPAAVAEITPAEALTDPGEASIDRAAPPPDQP